MIHKGDNTMAQKCISKQFIENEIEFWKIPSVAIAVVKDDEIVMSEAFGYKDVENKIPATPKTQYGIASCSKSFTSTIIAMLVDEGKLDYDVPIIEYFPDFKMYDEFATKECTLRDMLSHRTGLAPHDALWIDTIDRSTLWERLRYLKPMAPFRAQTLYNNTIYTLIGHIAEKITGQTWDDLIKERLFKPLGMTNSNTSADDMVKAPDYAIPYWEGKDGIVRKVDVLNVDLGGPAASINSCVEDLIKWVNFHINDGELNGKQIVSKENMQQMHTMNVPFKLFPWLYEELPHCGGYGMAWFTDGYRGNQFVWHTGEIEGYCSIIGFLPDKKIGITMLMNLHKPCMPFIFTLAYQIFDNLLGYDVIDWSSRIRPYKGVNDGCIYHWDVDQMVGVEQIKDAPMSHLPEEYVGDYFNPGYGDFKIMYRDGAFIGLYRGVEQVMEHFHYDVMRVPDVREDTLLVVCPLRFITGVDGKISGFDIKLDTETAPIVFERC